MSFGTSQLNVNNSYDSAGRIVSTGYDDLLSDYTYDSNNQIIRNDNNISDYVHYTATYSYDDRGNVTSKNIYDYCKNENITSQPIETTNFTYANFGWKDLLIAVNDVELTYDEIGNVLTYGDREFTWNTGRNLESIVDGENEYSYTYDENGIRTSKTVNGVTTYFNTRDGVILSQTDGTNTMYFQYDTNGVPFGFIYNGTQYLYVTNIMGDVISITDAQGNEIVEYEYDEWGGIASIFSPHNSESEVAFANINPIRYRGYYFDNETGYYYLQSRYYDPSICRFINADIPEIVKIFKDIFAGTNHFVYCSNDPINYFDYNGMAKLMYYPKPVGLNDFYSVFKKYLNNNYTGNINVYKSSFRVSGTRYLRIYIDANWKVIKSLIRDTSTLISVISLCCEVYYISVIGLILALFPYYTDNFPDNRRFRIVTSRTKIAIYLQI